MEQEKKYPEPAVGVIVCNDRGEVLLTKSPRWKDGEVYNLPGGHIEIGESAEETAIREVKEETGLEIGNLEFLGYQNAIFPKEFINKTHFVFLEFKAKLKSGEAQKSDENIEFVWTDPKEALEKLNLNPFTKVTVENFIKERDKGDCEEKYKRALADYHNLLKQTAREKDEFAKYANERMIVEFIPVYDNLKTSLVHAGEETNSWLDGIKYVVKQFGEVLKSFGIEEIKTVGETFDHNIMEAVATEETDDENLDHVVAKEISSGYKLQGKVIKAARVAVFEWKHE